MRLFLLLISVILLVNYSCTWRKENLSPLNDSNCDTAKISYSKVVQPILSNNCYSCHSTAATVNGGLDLENFSSLSSYLNIHVNGSSESLFYKIISQSPGYLSMPPVYKLSDCDIAKIKAWIDKGALMN